MFGGGEQTVVVGIPVPIYVDPPTGTAVVTYRWAVGALDSRVKAAGTVSVFWAGAQYPEWGALALGWFMGGYRSSTSRWAHVRLDQVVVAHALYRLGGRGSLMWGGGAVWL